MRGYFEIGIFQGKTEQNIGTLWRSAYQLGANGIFTIGSRCKLRSSDTCRAWRHIPLRQFQDMESFLLSLPCECLVIGVEMRGVPLSNFSHPERAIYLLGAEDHGLTDKAKEQCHSIVSLESVRTESYNVAVAGSIVMYDRFVKRREHCDVRLRI